MKWLSINFPRVCPSADCWRDLEAVQKLRVKNRKCPLLELTPRGRADAERIFELALELEQGVDEERAWRSKWDQQNGTHWWDEKDSTLSEYQTGVSWFKDQDEGRRLGKKDTAWLLDIERKLDALIYERWADPSQADPKASQLLLYSQIRDAVVQNIVLHFHANLSTAVNHAVSGTLYVPRISARQVQRERMLSRVQHIVGIATIEEMRTQYDDDEHRCLVCHDPLGKKRDDQPAEKPVRLPCGHIYGAACMETWLGGWSPNEHLRVCLLCNKNWGVIPSEKEGLEYPIIGASAFGGSGDGIAGEVNQMRRVHTLHLFPGPGPWTLLPTLDFAELYADWLAPGSTLEDEAVEALSSWWIRMLQGGDLLSGVSSIDLST